MPIWYTGTRNLPLPLINHKNASLQKEIGSSYIFVAVFFTRNFVVNENGQVTDVKLTHPSEDKNADEILINAICNMPKWKPAKDDDGSLTSQNFVLMAGDKESCTLNLLKVKEKHLGER